MTSDENGIGVEWLAFSGAERVEQPGPGPVVYLAYGYAGGGPRCHGAVGFSAGYVVEGTPLVLDIYGNVERSAVENGQRCGIVRTGAAAEGRHLHCHPYGEVKKYSQRWGVRNST